MQKFAKLYEHSEYGQILVVIDQSDDEGRPAVRFSFIPTSLGVCSVAVLFSDTDLGWEQAEAFFNAVDYEAAVAKVSPICEDIMAPFRNEEKALCH